MEENRISSGKIMYSGEVQVSQAGQGQAVQAQHTQTVTIQQPRVIFGGKQMPVTVQQADLQQSNVRIIYPQSMQVQMQVPGDPNLRTATAYVLANQPGDGSVKTERDGQLDSSQFKIIYHPQPMQVQMQMQDPNVRRVTHLGLNSLQVNPDGRVISSDGEPVICEVDLRQYPMQMVQHQGDEHMRTTVMTTAQYQEEIQQHQQHIDQSQQTQQQGTITAYAIKKKEKVLLPCLHCKDSFRTECQRAAHVRNKHIKPFKCDNCWKAFSFESQLKLHVTTHTGEKPYQCDVCPKAYARKTALFNHVRVHARKKFFKCCKYCGKGFKNEEKLEKHERAHSMSEVRKYMCFEMNVDKPV